ncbi:hypothetical protein [Desulfurella multipotens]|uniref:hypothetical protein n=1 Tax=Desulfurella TaxID=33001 RepID=UPI000CBCC2A9|nr:hypothetical protein [Desulfurella multipotens]PMP64424.1 MAG: hypothetical protein C0192_06420 [Desulfurella multipotens]
MKKILFCLAIFIFFATKVYADQYRLVVGKILSIDKNTAKVVIYSKVCSGKHTVYVKNTQAIPNNLIHKVNFVMQIDRNCSKVLLANPNSKGVQ